MRATRLAIAVWSLVFGATACRQLLGLDDLVLHGDAGSDGSDHPVMHDGRSDGTIDDGSGGSASDGCDPAACAASAGTCVAGVCTIDPTGSSAYCPAGMPCKITCGSCGPTLDCSKATSCVIDCAWDGSCQGKTIRCAGDCKIECRGSSTCMNDSVMSPGPACSVECCGQGSCGALTLSTCNVDDPGTCP